MPWKVRCPMSERAEFVSLALVEGANIRELCRRFQVSAKTGYKWLQRHREYGAAGLGDRSRRPQGSPHVTGAEMTGEVIELRRKHPSWGGRKLKRRLEDLGREGVPSASTITEILRRHQLLTNPMSTNPPATQRFEHAHPNDLWQMDFKGHIGVTRGGRCHPLTVLDDHSRYALALQACENEQGETVQRILIELFRRYGMPRRMLMDNGSPWGDSGGEPWTRLTVWLLRLGVSVTHGRPYHPQTQGKEERFHRTLLVEVLRDRSFQDVPDCQAAFDPWRRIYNHERPHEALGLAVPASRYRVSGRSYPEQLPAVEYDTGTEVRQVNRDTGRISFQMRQVRIGKAFRGEAVGLQATEAAGIYRVYYCDQYLGWIDLRTESETQEGFVNLNRARAEAKERERGSR